MNMKKNAALSLSLALSLGLSAQAFATSSAPTITQEGERTVTVSANIEPTYTVEIPGDVQVEFNALRTVFGEILLSEARLEPNHGVKVTLASSGHLTHTEENSKTIPYRVTCGDEDFTGSTFTTKGFKSMFDIVICQKDWNAAVAGEYRDTVTFTVEYVKIGD